MAAAALAALPAVPVVLLCRSYLFLSTVCVVRWPLTVFAQQVLLGRPPRLLIRSASKSLPHHDFPLCSFHASNTVALSNLLSALVLTRLLASLSAGTLLHLSSVNGMICAVFLSSFSSLLRINNHDACSQPNLLFGSAAPSIAALGPVAHDWTHLVCEADCIQTVLPQHLMCVGLMRETADLCCSCPYQREPISSRARRS